MTIGKITIAAAWMLVIAFVSASQTKADPLFFSNVVALQDAGNTRVDLFSNPNTTILASPQINFLVDVSGSLPAGTPNTLSVTYVEVGRAPQVQTYSIPLFGRVDPPFTLLFSCMSYGVDPAGITATLTLDIIGSSPDFVIPSGPNAGARVDSQTYTFNVRPVPEPASILLLGTALIGVAGRLRSRR